MSWDFCGRQLTGSLLQILGAATEKAPIRSSIIIIFTYFIVYNVVFKHELQPKRELLVLMLIAGTALIAGPYSTVWAGVNAVPLYIISLYTLRPSICGIFYFPVWDI